MDVEDILKIFCEEFRNVYKTMHIASSFHVKQAISITNSKISTKITDRFSQLSIEKQQQLEQERIKRLEFTQKMLETMNINPRKRNSPDDITMPNKHPRI